VVTIYSSSNRFPIPPSRKNRKAAMFTALQYRHPHPTISLPETTATKFPRGQMKVAIVVKKVK